MTTVVAPAPGARRDADPLSQLLTSGAVIVAAGAIHALVVYRVVLATDPPVEVGMWLAPALWMCPPAAAIAIRARDGVRRRRALAVLAVALLFSFAGPVTLGPSLVVERYGDFHWLVDAAGKISTVLVVAAWGIARRHGRWWWVGLAAALAMDVVRSDLQLLLLDLLPWGSWDVTVHVLAWAPTVVGIGACWLIDVLTTRPVPRGEPQRGTLVA